MIVLEAFETVENSKRESYEALCRQVDGEVERDEPGMLVHLLTTFEENTECATYRWIEVLKDEDALLAHLTAEHVSEHVERLNAENLVRETRILIHTDWSRARIAEWCTAHSLDVELFAEKKLGYVK